MRNALTSLAVLSMLALAGCGPPARPPATQPTSKPVVGAMLVLKGSQPAHADVVVDGKVAGKLGALASSGLPLQPGIHRIEVRAPGHRTFRLELRFEKGRQEPLKITLERLKRP